MDREAWRAAIHGVAKSRTRLSDWTEVSPHIHTSISFKFPCFPRILSIISGSLVIPNIYLYHTQFHYNYFLCSDHKILKIWLHILSTAFDRSGGEEVCDCWDLDLRCIKPRAPANCQILMRPPWSIHWNSSSWVSAATRTGNISRSTDPLNPAWTSELQNSEKEQNHYYFKPLNLGWFIM